MCGDLQFTTQSSLAIVLLQQYTSPLSRWRQMVLQTEADNRRSLQDRSVARYCQGMMLLIDSVQGEGGGDQAVDRQRRSRGRNALPPSDPSTYSPAERRFVDVCQSELDGASSVHLSLFAITKAKLQFLFKAPRAAVETLKLVNVELVQNYPEIVTYLVVQSLAYLALLRQHCEENHAASAHMRAAAAEADDEELELPAPYADWWRRVNQNQLSLSRFSTSNPRDFSCGYLLVRAEMAYSALQAFDCGYALESVAELGEELLPPTEARTLDQSYTKAATKAGQLNNESKQADGGATQNQLGKVMQRKARDDKREADAEEKRNDQATVAKAGTVSSGSSQRTDKQLLAMTVGGSRRKLRTLLSDDPFLRDQLIARIFTVYSSAAALTISSRSSSNYQRDRDTTGSQTSGSAGSQHSGSSHSSHDHRSSRHSSSAHSQHSNSRSGSGHHDDDEEGPGDAVATSDRKTVRASKRNNAKETSRVSNSTRSNASSHASSYSSGSEARHSINDGSSGALRCNDFMEGLTNELVARFQYYGRRPAQAMNFLLTAMRAYTRWNAYKKIAAMQEEFAVQFADAISILTSGLGIKMMGSHMARTGDMGAAGGGGMGMGMGVDAERISRMHRPFVPTIGSAVTAGAATRRVMRVPMGSHAVPEEGMDSDDEQLGAAVHAPSRGGRKQGQLSQFAVQRTVLLDNSNRGPSRPSSSRAEDPDIADDSLMSVGVSHLNASMHTDLAHSSLGAITLTHDHTGMESMMPSQMDDEAMLQQLAASAPRRNRHKPQVRTTVAIPLADMENRSHSRSSGKRSKGKHTSDGGSDGSDVTSVSMSDDSIIGSVGPSDGEPEALDLQTIIRAIQTISREVVLSRLVETLIRMVLHNAGGHSASLLTRRGKLASSGTDESGADSDFDSSARRPSSANGGLLSGTLLDDAVLPASLERPGSADEPQRPAASSSSAEDAAVRAAYEAEAAAEGEWQIGAKLESGDRERLFLHPQYRTSNEAKSTSPVAVSPRGESSVDSSSPSSSPPSLSDYPQSILNFVLHSHKSVILSNAVNDAVFGQDPVIVSRQVRSILCLPLMLRNQLIAVIYIEHRELPAAFTRGRLLCCRLIMQQAAISMETAKLYATLESKVQQRTAQLNQATEIATEANKAKSTFLAKSHNNDTRGRLTEECGPASCCSQSCCCLFAVCFVCFLCVACRTRFVPP